ncbi:hypothetical protein KIPB_005105 [Kipferlia bialata]|uniref:RZ-type domain-containing protein n=1 Tax=Kipferlia bialata TaxID=797122 RepID=A0A9K3CUV4_9EUKA|nr:hypothetical protein KIPB_005105 [Kipferlia bialata]|eukprot:g5105.t1
MTQQRRGRGQGNKGQGKGKDDGGGGGGGGGGSRGGRGRNRKGKGEEKGSGGGGGRRGHGGQQGGHSQRGNQGGNHRRGGRGSGGRGRKSQGFQPTRISDRDIETVFQYARLRPSDYPDQADLATKLVDNIAFSAGLCKSQILRSDRRSLIVGCPDETIGANMLRRLTETHSLFKRDYIEDILLGRSKFPQKDVESVVLLLNRAIELCGANISIDQAILELSIRSAPSYTSTISTILTSLRAETERRQALEREQMQRVADQGVAGGIGAYSGTPRDQINALDTMESLKGFGNVLERERAMEAPRVEPRYVSVDVQLDTYAALERDNFNLPIREVSRAFFKNERVDPRDIMHISNARFVGVMRDESQSRIQLRVSFLHPQRSMPAMLEYGRLLLVSADKWATAIPLMALGQIGDVLAKQRRFNRNGKGGHGHKHQSKRNGWDTLIVEVLTDMYPFSSADLDSVLRGQVEILGFSDRLLPAYVPIVSNLKAKQADSVPFGGVLAGVDAEMPPPQWVRGHSVDVSVLYHRLGQAIATPFLRDRRLVWEGEMDIHGTGTVKAMLRDHTCRADPTQLAGIRHTHNNAVTLIRGGPGTGKSYTAKLILEILLKAHKSHAINGPIIIVTYTNQALDTLLEGVLEFTDEKSILRIGGRPRTTDERILGRQFTKLRKGISQGQGNKGRVYDGYRHKEETYDVASDAANTLIVFSRLEQTLEHIVTGQTPFKKIPPQLQRQFMSLCNEYLEFMVDGHGGRLQFLSAQRTVRLPKERLDPNRNNRKVFQRLPTVPGLPEMDLLQSVWRLCHLLDSQDEFTEMLRRVDRNQALLYRWVAGDNSYSRILANTERDLKQRYSEREVTQSNRFDALSTHGGAQSTDDMGVSVLEARIAGIGLSSVPSYTVAEREGHGHRERERERDGDEYTESDEEGSESSESSEDAVYVDMQYHRDVQREGQPQAKETLGANKLPEKPWALSPREVQQWMLMSLRHTREGQEAQGGLTIGDDGSVLTLIKSLQRAVDQLRLEQDKGLEQGLQQSRIPIIAFTSTAAARYLHLLQGLQPSVMLVEEAGELTESQLLACMCKSLKHIILIGDEQQLRPKVEYAVQGDPTNFDWSMFERLTKMGLQRVQLSTQRRMRPEICGLINHAFNQGLETGAPASLITGAYPTLQKPLFFLQHSHSETSGQGTSRSYTNEYEANMLVNLLPLLCNNGFTPKDITIISLYKGQMFKIRETIDSLGARIAKVEKRTPSRHVLRVPRTQLSDVSVVCLDDYQGQENKVILVSLTRSQKMGFTKLANRALVTLSRAKEVMIVCGHNQLYGPEAASPEWRLVHEYFRESPSPLVGYGPSIHLGCPTHGTALQYSSPDQLDPGSGWCLGGCDMRCGQRLLCGHTCPLACHGGDHTLEGGFSCKDRCTKVCASGHRCKGVCSTCQADKACRKCTEHVAYPFPCGHTANVQCWKARDLDSPPVCHSRCEKALECGHPCALPCGHEGLCSQGKCTVVVPSLCPTCDRPFSQQCDLLCVHGPAAVCVNDCAATLQCGHTCTSKCGQCTQSGHHSVCDKRHFRVLGCGHICGGQCGHDGECHCNAECELSTCSHGACPAPCSRDCPPCDEPCTLHCEHSSCGKRCHEDCDREPCERRCGKNIPGCGCRCRGLCGEPCPPCPVHNKAAYEGQVSFLTMTPLLEECEEYPEELLYYIPTCRHVFMVEELDQALGVREDNILASEEMNVTVTCPADSCRTLLNIANAPRYQRLIREVISRNNEIKAALAEAAAQPTSEVEEEEAVVTELTEREKKEIGNAMGGSNAQAGHWYKHDCGYLYYIGDCGGATVQTVCPNCFGTLGGMGHSLTEGNTVASDIDGSVNSAWPGGEMVKHKETVTEEDRRQRRTMAQRAAVARREAEALERRRIAQAERQKAIGERTRQVLLRQEAAQVAALAGVGCGGRALSRDEYHEMVTSQYTLAKAQKASLQHPEAGEFVDLCKSGGTPVHSLHLLTHPRYTALAQGVGAGALTAVWSEVQEDALQAVLSKGGASVEYSSLTDMQAMEFSVTPPDRVRKGKGKGKSNGKGRKRGGKTKASTLPEPQGETSVVLMHYADMSRGQSTRGGQGVRFRDQSAVALRYVFRFA